MPLRPLLESTPETVNDLALAAEERYWDAYELAVQGRTLAAIYVAGFTAEMLLKVAGFRFDGAAPGDAIQPRLGPAKMYGSVRFPAIVPESYHSLLFWTWFLEHKRMDAGRPLDATFLAELRTKTGRIYETWWICLRYRISRPVVTTVRAEMLPLLEDVDWMLKNHFRMWS